MEEPSIEASVPTVKKRRTLKETNAVRRELGLPTYGDVIVKKVTKVVRRGRPPKVSIVANTDKARQQQLLAALLHSKGERIIKQILEHALDTESPYHKDCLRMCVDRVLPMSYFDKNKDGVGNKGVTIQILGVNEPKIIASSDDDVDDGDVIATDEDVDE